MNKPIPNLRKLKHIEKAAQRDWKNRFQIRADGLRALGFYSDPYILYWANPVKILIGMLNQLPTKRRAAIFRVARATMKRGGLIKIQSLGTPNWLDLKKMDASVGFVSRFKTGDLRELQFSTPELDRIKEKQEKIIAFIREQTDSLSKLDLDNVLYPVWAKIDKVIFCKYTMFKNKYE
jgi:hypothetical protein